MRDRRRRAQRWLTAMAHSVGRHIGTLLDVVLPDIDDLAPDPRRPAEQVAVAIISWARAMTVVGVAFALLAAVVLGAKVLFSAG